MSDIIERIKLKIKKIEQFQREQANQEGQKEQLLKQLEEVSGTSSIKEADKELGNLGKELIEYEELLEDLDNQMGEIISNATPKQDDS
jgi:hypothetical protein